MGLYSVNATYPISSLAKRRKRKKKEKGKYMVMKTSFSVVFHPL